MHQDKYKVCFRFRISPYLYERFSQAFEAPSVRLVSIAGNHFVLVNSMAMEGDGCFLCHHAEVQIHKIAGELSMIFTT